MSEEFQPLGESFSIADADAPTLAYERDILVVRFQDWRERTVELRFNNVVAFSWDDGDAALCNTHRDDTSYVVIGSEWLRRHLEVRNMSRNEGHGHYKLCFNAAGILQMISSELTVIM